MPASSETNADVKTNRQIYSELSLPRSVKKILMLFDGGRIEPLAES